MQVLAIAQSRVNASIHKFVICIYGRLPYIFIYGISGISSPYLGVITLVPPCSVPGFLRGLRSATLISASAKRRCATWPVADPTSRARSAAVAGAPPPGPLAAASPAAAASQQRGRRLWGCEASRHGTGDGKVEQFIQELDGKKNYRKPVQLTGGTSCSSNSSVDIVRAYVIRLLCQFELSYDVT